MGMLITVLLQIISRVIFSNPFMTTEELARYFYIWLAFVGLSWLYSNRQNISLSLLKDRLNPRSQIIIEIVINILTISVFALILIWSPKFIGYQLSNKSPALHVKQGLVYMILPISMVLSIFRIIQVLREDIIAIKKLNKTERIEL